MKTPVAAMCEKVSQEPLLIKGVLTPACKLEFIRKRIRCDAKFGAAK
jgi:hypothetical protein